MTDKEELKAANVELFMPKKLNIYQRINEIKKQCEYVQKDVERRDKKWSGVSHDAVSQLVRSEMIAQGVITKISLHSSTLEAFEEKTIDGLTCWLYRGDYYVDFINIDEPRDYIQLRIEGLARGETDKLSSMAMSQALKMAMLKTFNLITEENDESEVYLVASDDYIDVEQRLTIENAAVDRGLSLDQLEEVFVVDDLRELKAVDFDKILRVIAKI